MRYVEMVVFLRLMCAITYAHRLEQQYSGWLCLSVCPSVCLPAQLVKGIDTRATKFVIV